MDTAGWSNYILEGPATLENESFHENAKRNFFLVSSYKSLLYRNQVVNSSELTAISDVGHQ